MLVEGIAFVVLGLLAILGWKRAGRWMDKIVGKDEPPVV
jgi:hypothetical protein